MGKRVYCLKHKVMHIANPIWFKNSFKVRHWKLPCGCIYSKEKIEDIVVKTKYYTNKSGELTNHGKQGCKWTSTK